MNGTVPVVHIMDLCDVAERLGIAVKMAEIPLHGAIKPHGIFGKHVAEKALDHLFTVVAEGGIAQVVDQSGR